MLQVVNGLLNFPEFKVLYKQHGKELESYTNDKSWWKAFAKKWSHTEIIRFEDAEFTQEQHRRLKEVEHLDEAFSHLAAEYALNGRFPDELTEEEGYMKEHPLKQLQLDKYHQKTGQQTTNLEIENFMLQGRAQSLGMQNTKLEITVMMNEQQNAMLGQQITELELQLINQTEG